jgi:hypothetical protein
VKWRIWFLVALVIVMVLSGIVDGEFGGPTMRGFAADVVDAARGLFSIGEK